MAFPTGHYDAETIALMTKAFDAAWDETEYVWASNDFDPDGARRLMALRIMAAVRGGERDSERLKELAIEAVSETY